jgi:AcrR family transcriptional regulator
MPAIQRGVTAPERTRHRHVKPRRGRPPIPDARQRILSAAAALFAQKEFHRVSTEEVAERAGTGKGTVYRHFPSKEALYVGASIYGLSRLRNDLTIVLDTAPSTRHAIEVIVRQLLAYFWDKRDFFLLLQNPAGLAPDYRRHYKSERRKLSLIIRDTLAAGVDEGVLHSQLDVRVAAEALLGMVRAARRVRSYSLTLAETSNGVLALFLNGCLDDRTSSRVRTNT